MNKKHLILGLIIVIVFSYIAFKNVSLTELGNAFKAVKYLYLLPAVLLMALTFLFRAMRWRYLIRSIKEVKTSRLFSPLMVGFMGNVLPARAGEFIRAYLLGKKENVSFSASFATIVVERLLDLFLFLLLLVGVLLFSADTLAQGSASGSHNLISIMKGFGWSSFALAIMIFLFFVLLQYKNHWAMKIIGICIKPLPHKWGEKIVDMVNSFTDGLKILKDIRGFLAALALSFLVWTAMVFTYYPIHLAFGLESQLPMITSILIVSLSIGIFISLFPAPAFLGSFQLACVVALHEVFGISEAVAASYGIIAWLVAMGFIIVSGVIFIVKDNISFAEIAASREKAN
ncbi:MAG: flippase-like domain-containing protein [Thermodesulfovibrionia bacterium]|nr:flippase-like domain-containing protein [Thermodesulfovibrionia bacterium]